MKLWWLKMNDNIVRSAQDCFNELASASSYHGEIAAFCGVETVRIAEWLTNGIPTKGDSLYRLWVLLAFNGYKVEEISNLPEVMFRFSALLAGDVLNYSEVAKGLGYSETSALYRLLRGEGAPSRDKMWNIEQMVAKHESDIEVIREVATVRGHGQHTHEAAQVSSDTRRSLDANEVAIGRVVKDQRRIASTSTAARLFQEYMRRAKNLDDEELAASIREVLSPDEVEHFALFLLELNE